MSSTQWGLLSVGAAFVFFPPSDFAVHSRAYALCLCLELLVKVCISLLICSLHDAFLAFLNFFMVYTFSAKAE
jgi:hypothetical protein